MLYAAALVIGITLKAVVGIGVPVATWSGGTKCLWNHYERRSITHARAARSVGTALKPPYRYVRECWIDHTPTFLIEASVVQGTCGWSAFRIFLDRIIFQIFVSAIASAR